MPGGQADLAQPCATQLEQEREPAPKHVLQEASHWTHWRSTTTRDEGGASDTVDEGGANPSWGAEHRNQFVFDIDDGAVALEGEVR